MTTNYGGMMWYTWNSSLKERDLNQSSTERLSRTRNYNRVTSLEQLSVAEFSGE